MLLPHPYKQSNNCVVRVANHTTILGAHHSPRHRKSSRSVRICTSAVSWPLRTVFVKPLVGDLQLLPHLSILCGDLHVVGHTFCQSCPIGRQGTPPSRKERWGERSLAPKSNNVGYGSPQDRWVDVGDVQEEIKFQTTSQYHYNQWNVNANVQM